MEQRYICIKPPPRIHGVRDTRADAPQGIYADREISIVIINTLGQLHSAHTLGFPAVNGKPHTGGHCPEVVVNARRIDIDFIAVQLQVAHAEVRKLHPHSVHGHVVAGPELTIDAGKRPLRQGIGDFGVDILGARFSGDAVENRFQVVQPHIAFEVGIRIARPGDPCVGQQDYHEYWYLQHVQAHFRFQLHL